MSDENDPLRDLEKTIRAAAPVAATYEVVDGVAHFYDEDGYLVAVMPESARKKLAGEDP